MAGFTPAAPGRVFIGYRRDVADLPADWLDERLVARFGHDQVFDQVDSIESGDEFAEVIVNTIRACDVLLTPAHRHRAVEHGQVIARQVATDCPRIRV
jgi:predicted Zn-dependent protease